MKKLLILLTLILVSFGLQAQSSEKPYVVMVSFDGFRHDYVEKFNTPNFKKFISKGTAAKSMTPSYPSKTFPNHYTLVTGMYPGNHGLVDNSFFAPDLNLAYSTRNRERVENPKFYGGLPLWQLVQNNGMKSASYFWVGSEAPIQGSFPDYYHIYDGSVANEERIKGVERWLNLPIAERPHFITLYFSLVDSQGHATGPNAKETGDAVLEADRLLGLLMDAVDKIDLPVNVILTSDHGMVEVTPEPSSFTAIDELLEGLNPDDFRFVNNGAHAHFYVEDASKRAGIFKTLQSRENGFKTYMKNDIPEHMHYRHNSRVGDIFIVSDPGHYITSKGRIAFAINNKQVRGEHGFDPYATSDIGAIFYAKGPNFKSGLTIDPFENIHIYPIVAKILGIDKLPEIDGRLEVLAPILKD